MTRRKFFAWLGTLGVGAALPRQLHPEPAPTKKRIYHPPVSVSAGTGQYLITAGTGVVMGTGASGKTKFVQDSYYYE